VTYVLQHPSQGLQIVGEADGDVVGAGVSASQDWLIGHTGGQDRFDFQSGDGSDIVIGFERGTDLLVIHGSVRQTSLRDTEAGTEVYFAAFGQSGPDHFVVSGVHGLSFGDFVFA
jgi:hypothetical protein